MSGTGEAFALATSTPGAPSGRFYEIHQRRPGLKDWQTVHVTLSQAIGAGRVSKTWADQRALQWGAESAVYQNRVLGEFASSDEDGVIPLAWVEAAVDRWNTWAEAGKPAAEARRVVGVDVARSGTDQTVLALRRGHIVESIEHYRLSDTMTTTGHVAARLSGEGRPMAVVDVIGIGAGVVDRLRELRHTVTAFHASERSTRRDRSGELGFLNRRAEAWWHLRELLEPAYGATLALPDDDELIGDLCAPRWAMNSTGRIQVESKDEIRKRLGRSTDVGDAIVMAMTVAEGAFEAPVVFFPVSAERHPISGLREPDPPGIFRPEPVAWAPTRTPARWPGQRSAPGPGNVVEVRGADDEPEPGPAIDLGRILSEIGPWPR